MRARDVMTTGVVTVAPDALVRQAAELLAAHGFAALPVVDDDRRLVGIITEADVLRQRVPPGTRPLCGDNGTPAPTTLGLPVQAVMTEDVRAVEATTQLADLACLFVGHHLRSLPVLERGRLVGIVSRRDLLRTLVRPDRDVRDDVVRLLEAYTGAVDCWAVEVTAGVATIASTAPAGRLPEAMDARALQRLVATVPGVVAVHVREPADRC